MTKAVYFGDCGHKKENPEDLVGVLFVSTEPDAANGQTIMLSKITVVCSECATQPWYTPLTPELRAMVMDPGEVGQKEAA